MLSSTVSFLDCGFLFFGERWRMIVFTKSELLRRIFKHFFSPVAWHCSECFASGSIFGNKNNTQSKPKLDSNIWAYCGKSGHWQRDCHKKKADQQQQQVRMVGESHEPKPDYVPRCQCQYWVWFPSDPFAPHAWTQFSWQSC